MGSQIAEVTPLDTSKIGPLEEKLVDFTLKEKLDDITELSEPLRVG